LNIPKDGASPTSPGDPSQCFTTLHHPSLSAAAHQVLADVVHELPVVQAPVLPQMVEEHLAEPLAAHAGAAHAQSELAGLRRRAGRLQREPESSAPARTPAPRQRTPVPTGVGGTHFDNLPLRVLEVEQQRHQPVEDLLEEDFGVAFAELGEVAEEHDGRLAEVGLLLRAGDERGSAGSDLRWASPTLGTRLAGLIPPPTASLPRLEGIRAARETPSFILNPQHLLPALTWSSAFRV